jgi:hypothetical protein
MLTTDRVAGAALVLLSLAVLLESRRLPLGSLRNPGRGTGADRHPRRPRGFKGAMDKLETPIVFKQGEEFAKFFEADARRLAEGVPKVGRIEAK